MKHTTRIFILSQNKNEQNVSPPVNLNHVLKLGVYDKVNRVGECLSKLKLDAKVALFYKLKMITQVNDTSEKPGSHWVAFYFTKDREGEFVDYYG